MLENYEKNCCLITNVRCFVLFIRMEGITNCYLDHITTFTYQSLIYPFAIVVIMDRDACRLSNRFRYNVLKFQF